MTPTVYSKCHKPVTVNSIRKGRTESIAPEPVHTFTRSYPIRNQTHFNQSLRHVLWKSTISRLTDTLFILKINRLI